MQEAWSTRCLLAGWLPAANSWRPLRADPPLSAIEHVLLAVSAAHDGDNIVATDHISRARQQTRTAARRERQVIEIAALVVAGDRSRAAGLALEHSTEFPEDANLLHRVTLTDRREPGTAQTPTT